jgi:3-oxoacyl-[acyl-carrier protein] reductase
MNKEFSNRSVIVTGAGQGIGFEICNELAARGAGVLLNDIESGLAHEAAEKIRKKGGRCEEWAGDASDLDFIQTLVAESVRHFGRLDALVANAGITQYGEFMEYGPEDFDKVMGVNVRGTFFLAQAAARQMKQQGEGGRIVFVSSVTGRRAHKDLAAYGMTKAAVDALTRNLVPDLSPLGITINGVAPGATLTPRTALDKDYEKTWSKITPAGRPASPIDTACAVAFLLSSGARHITGQTLVIDGGWTVMGPS